MFRVRDWGRKCDFRMLKIIGAIRTGSVGMEEKRGVNPRYCGCMGGAEL